MEHGHAGATCLRDRALVRRYAAGEPGDQVVRDGTVLVRDGVIESVGHPPVPSAVQRIDCSGCAVTAGLWNSHVHFFERMWAGAEAIPPTELDRQLLLVNWSPGCGFCLKIADELGGLQQQLDDRGVRLAFVTSGDADSNRTIFDGAGLTAPALLRQEGVDPFAGFGTPAAYLLDTEGKVTSITNPKNQATSYRFQYGRTTAYESATPERTLPSTGNASQAVSASWRARIRPPRSRASAWARAGSRP